MLMTNENIRLFPHDKLLAKTVLRAIPQWVLPNHVTVLRLILIPIVVYFFILESWGWMGGIFFFAGLTDVLDGSLARTRRQITMWGTVADPIADKLLVGLVVLFYVIQRVHLGFGIAIIGLEMLIVAGAFMRQQRVGYMTANVFGKMKMFLQVSGVSLLMLSQAWQEPLLMPFAIGVLVASVAVGAVSLVTYSF